MVFSARGYGEDPAFDMNRMDVFAWVTSGVKKVNLVMGCLVSHLLIGFLSRERRR